MPGTVIISPHPKKTKERIDFNGNVIDPETKQVIKHKEVESILPPEGIPIAVAPEAKVVTNSPEPVSMTDSPREIQRQIEETESRLEKLKEAKKVKIEAMEKELNELKNQ